MNSYDVGDTVVLEGTFSSDPVTVTVDTAGALAGATTVPVLDLSGPLPSGTVLVFDTPTTVTLTAFAAINATSLTVAPLDDPVTAGDVAQYPGGPTDPTDVTFLIQPTGQAVTEYVYGTDVELASASTGVYSVAWPVTDPYMHQYRFIGTGEIQQEQAGRFYARPRNVSVPVP